MLLLTSGTPKPIVNRTHLNLTVERCCGAWAECDWDEKCGRSYSDSDATKRLLAVIFLQKCGNLSWNHHLLGRPLFTRKELLSMIVSGRLFTWRSCFPNFHFFLIHVPFFILKSFSPIAPYRLRTAVCCILASRDFTASFPFLRTGRRVWMASKYTASNRFCRWHLIAVSSFR